MCLYGIAQWVCVGGMAARLPQGARNAASAPRRDAGSTRSVINKGGARLYARAPSRALLALRSLTRSPSRRRQQFSKTAVAAPAVPWSRGRSTPMSMPLRPTDSVPWPRPRHTLSTSSRMLHATLAACLPPTCTAMAVIDPVACTLGPAASDPTPRATTHIQFTLNFYKFARPVSKIAYPSPFYFLAAAVPPHNSR